MTKLPLLNSAVSLYRMDVQAMPGGPSMTRSEFQDECDINQIMARFEKTGMVPVNSVGVPQYLDLTMTPDNLMQAMNLMVDAETSFMLLPAHVRKEFDNDPMRFVEFASAADNIERMREWGLAPPAPAAELPELGSPERPISIAPAPEPETPARASKAKP
ncbi:MAG: internal scaffolding protein [Microvirus sp.]|nr:MAG: internal scaffolding protein [Microvirus sp.]